MNDSKKPGNIDSGVQLIAAGLGCFVAYRLYLEAMARLAALQHRHPLIWWELLGVILLLCLGIIAVTIWNRRADALKSEITEDGTPSICLGKDEQTGEPVRLTQKMKTSHMDIIGTTSVGKTESLVLPLSISDLESGAGLLIIDGKSDRSFLEKFYAYAVKYGRKDDFRLFSLVNTEESATFNPLLGGSVQEVTERIFSSLQFENEYYKGVQLQLFEAVLGVIEANKEIPTLYLIRQLLLDRDTLQAWVNRGAPPDAEANLSRFLKAPDSERAQNTAGLQAQLSRFTSGALAPLFNAEYSMIQMDEVLRDKRVCYFQLPSMYSPELAKATGRMVLQTFQSAVAKRQTGLSKGSGFFGCYLDDFQDYIYEGFGALLNKSRSANVGVVFSHQALGDLDKVGPAFRDIVMTNTNIKCVMRVNDPDTAEYFSRSFGTKQSEKVTERRTSDTFGERNTGEGSVREVQEFAIHPNDLRRLGVGRGVVSIPHFDGVTTARVRFDRREDIEPEKLPKVPKPRLIPIEKVTPATLEGDEEKSRVTTGTGTGGDTKTKEESTNAGA